MAKERVGGPWKVTKELVVWRGFDSNACSWCQYPFEQVNVRCTARVSTFRLYAEHKH